MHDAYEDESAVDLHSRNRLGSLVALAGTQAFILAAASPLPPVRVFPVFPVDSLSGDGSGGRFSNAANQIQIVPLREGRPSRRQRRRNRHGGRA